MLHPHPAGIVISTHNATIFNADHLFRRLGLSRYTEVDSEDQGCLKRAFALCCDKMGAMLASRLDPETIIVLKCNNPRCLRIHRKHRAVPYALEPELIGYALDRETDSRELTASSIDRLESSG